LKKILINGGGHSEIPLILASKKLGFYTITTGFNKDGLGHTYSDEYIYADFSDQTQIEDIVKTHHIDFVIPACNDFSILTTTSINEKISIGIFDSYETTKLLHHKSRFKTLALELGLNVAQSITFDKTESIEKLTHLQYPLIIKPIDLSGGKGVTKIDNQNQLDDAINKAFISTKEKSILIEEFIEGSHHSCSILIKNKKIILSFFANEYFYKNPYLVEGAYSNDDIDNTIKKNILKDSQTLIDTLNLSDGLLHIQFIIKDDTPYILEITRRSPGDLYLNLVSYSMGIDFASLIIKLHIGTLDKLDIKDTKQKAILRHCLMSDTNGKISELYFDNNLKKYLFDKLLWYRKDDIIENYLTYKAGIIFAEFEDIYTLQNMLKDIHNLIQIKTRTK